MTGNEEFVPQIVAFNLHRAVIGLVDEINDKSFLRIPLSTTLGERVQLLADSSEISEEISDILQRVIQSRNMLVHSGYQVISYESLVSMKKEVVFAYFWFLTKYKKVSEKSYCG